MRKKLSSNRPNPELVDDDNPEWTQADFDNAVPFSRLPEHVKSILLGAPRGRPKSMAPKQRATVRLDADVLAALRAEGRGWQTRLNARLRALLIEHPKP
jgi:uncharacterized protein (DUF4415 family)